MDVWICVESHLQLLEIALSVADEWNLTRHSGFASGVTRSGVTRNGTDPMTNHKKQGVSGVETALFFASGSSTIQPPSRSSGLNCHRRTLAIEALPAYVYLPGTLVQITHEQSIFRTSGSRKFAHFEP